MAEKSERSGTWTSLISQNLNLRGGKKKFRGTNYTILTVKNKATKALENALTKTFQKNGQKCWKKASKAEN